MSDKAVLCGINNYDAIGDLRGCLQDTDNIARLLTENYGFSDSNIRIRHDEEVTLQTLESDLPRLAEGAQPGDRLVFHFSGHGSYIKSKDDDEEIDELLCLHDMDWGNAQSYLLDDHLGALLKKLPDFADITVILDCCHAGSGTRNFRPNELSRYVEPPAKYRVKDEVLIRARAASRELQRESAMNHLLLAGARDDQTAADAQIGVGYHGAFTFYLCQVARERGNSTSANSVMEHAVRLIKSRGFSQRPQIEGRGKADKLFGDRKPGGQVAQFVKNELTPTSLAVEKEADNGEALRLVHRLLDNSNKILDLAAHVIPSRLEATPATDATAPRAIENDVYVAIHGVSRQLDGYSDRWYEALTPHLTSPLERREVMWSDLVNKRSISTPGDEELEKSMTAQIHAELSERRAMVQHENQDGLTALRADGIGDIEERAVTDDFVKYMAREEIRDAILQRFLDVVEPLLETGRNIHIVAHSWGTVVAYEGLRQLDSKDYPGRVINLHTLGSALSIGPVRSNLFDRVTDGRRPVHVQEIYNIDAAGDIIGGPIEDDFQITKEFLRLRPVGCRTIPFTNTALNFVCAHSSYFNNRNLNVNRDILAATINEYAT